ncbi:hypothetical protein LGN17_35925 [Burkholderia sp. AU30280]|uniref:hypothetical protein n=1 Tax=Burkholderia sp. AU30280 TaxID=2879628 RepID=UPI001CF5D7A3|nr:hypothetical protein [Burkholderia sp. AU30280]MCA8277869.1 hypothetical protein [Burkholderia sp. AU30280]
MSKFTTRVVLHGVQDSDTETYEKLHAAMAKAKFYRTIQGSDDVWYEMPPAEYNRVAENTNADAIRDEASAAAKTVWHDYSILVTEGIRSWFGLKRAK